MLVLPQTVKVKWNKMNKKWLIETGCSFSKYGDEIEVNVLDLPFKSSIKVEVICDFCKNKILKKYYKYNESHKENEDSCNNCKYIKIADKNTKYTKYTYDNIKTFFESRNFILLEKEYKGFKENHRYKCSNNHESYITIQNLLRGSGCHQCAVEKNAKDRKRTIEEVRDIFIENNCILLSTEYINYTQKLDFICECGNHDRVTLERFLKGQRCKNCGKNRLRKFNLKYDIDLVKSIFLENNCILLEDKFIDSETPMKYICNCGRESKITLQNFLHGSRCRQCFLDRNKGKTHPSWNDEITEEERLIKRNYPEYNIWRQEVYERDNYTCQACENNNSGNLNAHHLDGYNWCKEKRTDVDNAVTLCTDCHTDFHHQYGYGGNTKEQFEEWIKNK